MGVRQQIIELATDLKTAAWCATATIGTGLGQLLELIPDDIGKLGTVVGILLSSVLFCYHVISLRILIREDARKESIREQESASASTSAQGSEP